MKEERGEKDLLAEVIVTTKTKLLRARCDLGMERSHMWVEHRVGLCIQTRVAGGGAGNDGRKNPMM